MKLFPKSLRQRAIDRAVSFVIEHLNGEDGLGAIFPAMANATMMFDVLGDRTNAAVARGSIEKLLVVKIKRPTASPAYRRLGHGARSSCIAGSR